MCACIFLDVIDPNIVFLVLFLLATLSVENLDIYHKIAFDIGFFYSIYAPHH